MTYTTKIPCYVLELLPSTLCTFHSRKNSRYLSFTFWSNRILKNANWTMLWIFWPIENKWNITYRPIDLLSSLPAMENEIHLFKSMHIIMGVWSLHIQITIAIRIVLFFLLLKRNFWEKNDKKTEIFTIVLLLTMDVRDKWNFFSLVWNVELPVYGLCVVVSAPMYIYVWLFFLLLIRSLSQCGVCMSL